MFNLFSSKFEFIIYLVVYVGDFYLLLFLNEFFFKDLDFD